MRVVLAPMCEADILRHALDEATPEEVIEAMRKKYECACTISGV